MARSNQSQPPIEPKQWTSSEDIDKAIGKLRRRIAELERVDVQATLSDASASDKVAVSNVRETLREVFGQNSPEFREHAHINMWSGALWMGMGQHDRLAAKENGRRKMIGILEGLIARLNEKKEELGEAAAPTTQAYLDYLNLHPRIKAVAGKRRKPAKQQHRRVGPEPLSTSRGPDPSTPIEQVELVVGAIIGTHGLYGELRVRLITDDPEHFETLARVLLGEQRAPYTVESVRFNRGIALVKLQGVDDIETAESLRGAVLRIPGSDARPLEESEYFLYQVIGIFVRDEARSELGTVTDIIETGANLVFVVTDSEGKEELYPSIPEVVLDLNPAEGYMVVRPLTYWDAGQASE
jgi:16S rRNA processing protein RimM